MQCTLFATKNIGVNRKSWAKSRCGGGSQHRQSADQSALLAGLPSSPIAWFASRPLLFALKPESCVLAAAFLFVRPISRSAEPGKIHSAIGRDHAINSPALSALEPRWCEAELVGSISEWKSHIN